jgi:hypothetical protein
MTKKQVHGLLDYMKLKDGEDWKFTPLSEEYMIGMGLGASREATRWAYKGYMLELHQNLASFKKKVGRKRKPEFGSIDCQRAMLIWVYLHKMNQNRNISLKNRHLISLMQSLGENDSRIKNLFPKGHSRLQSSVSAGKTKLEINDRWESKVCEKLLD